MTQAVCLGCGESKFGAWGPCQHCGCNPTDSDSMTRHLLVSSHFLNSDEMAEVARKVKAGEEIEFDPEKFEAYRVDPERLDRDMKATMRGCIGIVLLVLA